MTELIEMENGDFVAIGMLALPETEVPDTPNLTAHVGEGEEAVIIPRRYLIDAAREILRGEDIN